MRGICIDCGNETGRVPKALYCFGCRTNGDVARSAVFKAVKNGVLPSPKESACTDCGAQATQYDHRDYNKPLDVQPVCKKCNLRRGPAIPMRKIARETRSKTFSSAIRFPIDDWNRINEVMSNIGRSGFMKFINREYLKIKAKESK